MAGFRAERAEMPNGRNGLPCTTRPPWSQYCRINGKLGTFPGSTEHGSGQWSPRADGIVAHPALDATVLDAAAAGDAPLFEDVAFSGGRAHRGKSPGWMIRRRTAQRASNRPWSPCCTRPGVLLRSRGLCEQADLVFAIGGLQTANKLPSKAQQRISIAIVGDRGADRTKEVVPKPS